MRECSVSRPVWFGTLHMHERKLLNVAYIVFVGNYSVKGGVKHAEKPDIFGISIIRIIARILMMT